MAKFLLNAEEALADDFTGNFVRIIPFGEGYIFLMGNHRAVFGFCVLFLLFNRLPESTGGCVVGAIKSSCTYALNIQATAYISRQSTKSSTAIFFCPVCAATIKPSPNKNTLSASF